MSVNRRKPRLAQRCQLRMRRDTLGSWLRCQSSKADGSLAAARELACDMDADLGGPLFGALPGRGNLNRGLPRVSWPRDLSDDGADARAVHD